MSDAPLNESLRYRLRFSTSGPLAFISVLELSTVWERTLRRAQIPLRYSQGFNPRPKLQFAAPLPTGCGGEAELLDCWLESPLEPAHFATQLAGQLPPGLAVAEIRHVPEGDDALNEQLQAARYVALLRTPDVAMVQARVADFLAQKTHLRPRRGRRHRGKSYDLRALVQDLSVEPTAPWISLHMQLQARPGATGRPDEVLEALQLRQELQRCIRLALLGPH